MKQTVDSQNTEFNIQFDSDKSHIIITGADKWPKPIKIPSAMWPVDGRDPIILAKSNTEPCTSNIIREIFDSLPFRIGRCYDNTNMLFKALTNAGIQADAYAGWLLIDDTIPTHHAMVVVDEHCVLDPSSRNFNDLPSLPDNTDKQVIRDTFKQWILEQEKLPNSEKAVFGKVPPGHIYLMAKLAPEKAMALRAKLERAYPKHPSFSCGKRNNYTPIQQELIKRGIR